MSAYDLFPAGTRVTVAKHIQEDDDWGAGSVAGMTGTVVDPPEEGYFDDEEEGVCIEFDERLPYGVGHDCGGVTANGHGWNVLIKHLTKLQPDTPEFQAWCELDQAEDT